MKLLSVRRKRVAAIRGNPQPFVASQWLASKEAMVDASEHPALARLETTVNHLSQFSGLQAKVSSHAESCLSQSSGHTAVAVAVAAGSSSCSTSYEDDAQPDHLDDEAHGSRCSGSMYSEGTSCVHWKFGWGYEEHPFWKVVQHETTGTKLVVQWWDAACCYGCGCTNGSCSFQHSSEAAEWQVVGELWRPASSQRQ